MALAAALRARTKGMARARARTGWLAAAAPSTAPVAAAPAAAPPFMIEFSQAVISGTSAESSTCRSVRFRPEVSSVVQILVALARNDMRALAHDGLAWQEETRR
jgi:hypothetical protein